MTSDCHPIEQQARQDQIEALYKADGRHDPAHPAHATYTGLMVAQQQEQEVNATASDHDCRFPLQTMSDNFYIHDPFYVLVVEDDSGQYNGKAIVWEHEIPNGVTREAVEAQQQSIGDRYGATWIAECRVLPETLREPAPVTAVDVALAAAALSGEMPFMDRMRLLGRIRRFLRQQEAWL